MDKTEKIRMQTLFPNESPSSSRAPGAVQANQQTWSLIKAKLREFIEPQAFAGWIAPLEARLVSPSEIVVALPNLVFFQGIHNEYLDVIEQAKGALGLSEVLLRFEVDGVDIDVDEAPSKAETCVTETRVFEGASAAVHDDEAELSAKDATFEVLTASAAQEPGQAFSRSLSREGQLNPNYTFDNFVKGDSNQFAVATCLSAAENPGKAYNPLFIYGSTGLGKTHLLHAVGNMVLKNDPRAVVTYISSERFMNEMVYCIRFNKMWDFRQKYRNCDVFLVDDIQFIAKKTATQEEFFHTFNTLYAAKKQIVITSDLFPKDIPDIEDRLRNRFQWGLIADIQPPSIEHRIAILLSKAEQLNIRMSADVAEYIAKQAKRNVRELEGALHRINAYSTLHGEPISLDLAARTFKDVLGEPPKRLTIETVQKTVADHFKLRVADLKSKRRQRAFAHPRQIAMYLARKLTNASFPEIGEKFGGKDHTTVMHNVKKIEENVDKDLDLKAHVEALERSLEQLQ
jgi:chromosomal replication initiator protein